ncbi:MAG: hypothetical protein AAGG80_00585 [Pseudomonadota bacterium]
MTYIEILLTYLINETKVEDSTTVLEEVSQSMLSKTGAKMKTMADALKKMGFDVGLQQGMQQGMEQGMHQGKRQGLLQARKETANKINQIAKGMVNLGMQAEQIVKLTGLSLQEVQKLQTMETSQ